MGSCVGGGESDGNMIQKAPMNQVNQQAAFALKHFVVGEKPIFQNLFGKFSKSPCSAEYWEKIGIVEVAIRGIIFCGRTEGIVGDIEA